MQPWQSFWQQLFVGALQSSHLAQQPCPWRVHVQSHWHCAPNAFTSLGSTDSASSASATKLEGVNRAIMEPVAAI